MPASTNIVTLSLLHPLNKTPIQSWTFEEASVVRIGRSVSNDVVLYSAVVSRYHAELHQTPNGWEIHSVGTNGTFFADQRFEKKVVEDGLVIRLARSGPSIQFNIVSQPKAVPSIPVLTAQQETSQKAS